MADDKEPSDAERRAWHWAGLQSGSEELPPSLDKEHVTGGKMQGRDRPERKKQLHAGVTFVRGRAVQESDTELSRYGSRSRSLLTACEAARRNELSSRRVPPLITLRHCNVGSRATRRGEQDDECVAPTCRAEQRRLWCRAV